MEQQAYLEIKRQRRNLVLGLIAAIVVIDAAVLFTTGSEMETFVSDRLDSVALARSTLLNRH